MDRVASDGQCFRRPHRFIARRSCPGRSVPPAQLARNRARAAVGILVAARRRSPAPDRLRSGVDTSRRGRRSRGGGRRRDVDLGPEWDHDHAGGQRCVVHNGCSTSLPVRVCRVPAASTRPRSMDVLPVFDVAAWSAFAIASRWNAASSRHGSALYLGAPTIRGC